MGEGGFCKRHKKAIEDECLECVSEDLRLQAEMIAELEKDLLEEAERLENGGGGECRCKEPYRYTCLWWGSHFPPELMSICLKCGGEVEIEREL